MQFTACGNWLNKSNCCYTMLTVRPSQRQLITAHTLSLSASLCIILVVMMRSKELKICSSHADYLHDSVCVCVCVYLRVYVATPTASTTNSAVEPCGCVQVFGEFESLFTCLELLQLWKVTSEQLQTTQEAMDSIVAVAVAQVTQLQLRSVW